MPPPENIRFCTACGHPVEWVESSGRPRPVCPQCGTIYYFSPLVAVAAIVPGPDGRVLLVRRAENPGRGRWCLPGGYVEADELLTDALQRELAEETGLAITPDRILDVWSFFHEGKQLSGVVIVYVSLPSADDLRPGDDCLEARWVPWDQVDRMDLAFEAHREALYRFRSAS